MRTHLEAVFENGVFRPLQPVDLPEHQRVTVTVGDEVDDAGSDEHGQIQPLPAIWLDRCVEFKAPISARRKDQNARSDRFMRICLSGQKNAGAGRKNGDQVVRHAYWPCAAYFQLPFFREPLRCFVTRPSTFERKSA